MAKTKPKKTPNDQNTPSSALDPNAMGREALVREVLKVRKQVGDLEVAIKNLEDQNIQMRLSRPGSSKELLVSEVEAAIASNHQQQFLVVADYNRALNRGRVIHAHHYPLLLDYVRDGLRLALYKRFEIE